MPNMIPKVFQVTQQIQEATSLQLKITRQNILCWEKDLCARPNMGGEYPCVTDQKITHYRPEGGAVLLREEKVIAGQLLLREEWNDDEQIIMKIRKLDKKYVHCINLWQYYFELYVMGDTTQVYLLWKTSVIRLENYEMSSYFISAH